MLHLYQLIEGSGTAQMMLCTLGHFHVGVGKCRTGSVESLIHDVERAQLVFQIPN